MKKFLFILIASLVGTIEINAQVWTQTDKIFSLPNTFNEAFGTSVDMDGDYAVVGAYKYNGEQGCAYVLHYNGEEWETLACLILCC